MELGRSLGDPAVGPVGLQAQPKAFNGIEVGRSGWQINRLEVMPVEPLDLVAVDGERLVGCLNPRGSA